MWFTQTSHVKGWTFSAFIGLCLSVFAAQPSFAKGKHYGQVFEASGKPHAGAQVYVFSESTLASLYGDAEGKRPLANPVTAGKDGVYWFYADNGTYTVCKKPDIPFTRKVLDFDGEIYRYHGEGGAYLLHKNAGMQEAYSVIEEGVYICDPSEHREITASPEASALTLKQLDSERGDIKSAIVFKRESEPGSPAKGPWRWIINEVAPGQRPASFILVYNTDFVRGSGPKGFQWAPRDVEDVCIKMTVTPDNTTSSFMGYGGYFNYAVAPTGPAGARPVFRDTVKVKGAEVRSAASRLTVGEGMGNTRFFRNTIDHCPGEIPFPLAAARFFGGTVTDTTPGDFGTVWVRETDPAKHGLFRKTEQKAEENPCVGISGGTGGALCFASAGKAFVKVAPGVRVKVGDTLISSKAGHVEVDNSQKQVTRIVGWALENSGATRDGFVLAVLP